MTLYLQEELFSLDHFDIWDEDGNVKYQVERELFQFGRKLVVVDMQGREVCFVQHIPFSIPCAYELAVPGGSVRLDRHFSFFMQQYTIDELGWKVAGSFMSLDFEIMQGDRRVAYIEKAFPASEISMTAMIPRISFRCFFFGASGSDFVSESDFGGSFFG